MRDKTYLIMNIDSLTLNKLIMGNLLSIIKKTNKNDYYALPENVT